MATVEARTKKLRAKNFDGIVGHQIAQISYWRLMINAALMLLDMTMFILASAVVLTWKNELVFHSARFGFSMPFAVYCLLAACIWVLCLRSILLKNSATYCGRQFAETQDHARFNISTKNKTQSAQKSGRYL